MSIFSLLFGGCSKKPAAQSPVASDAPVIKVSVFADGRITADGSPATVDSLRESFKKLAEQKGAVWYYREAGQAEPPPQAMQVMQAVVEAGLPIRLSSRPDYSDSIGPDGKPNQ
jgi:biopolymer transport protein ExbD